MDGSFALGIALGNQACQTPEDVADLLEQVAQRLRNGNKAGKIQDANGQSVGVFDMGEDGQCDYAVNHDKRANVHRIVPRY